MFGIMTSVWPQEQVGKLREERETMARDLAVLRADLDSTRQVCVDLRLLVCEGVGSYMEVICCGMCDN